MLLWHFCFQLIAIQSECRNAIKEIEERAAKECMSLQEAHLEVQAEREALVSEAKSAAEVILGLQSEVHHLKNALSNASNNLGAVQDLSRVTGELEIVKQRLKDTIAAKVNFLQSLLMVS